MIISKDYLLLFGKIPNFNETLSVVRSHNIRICIVLQGLSQLKALYEKTWESIIGNCSIFTFLGTNDMDSKEYVSKKLGKTTVRVDSRSYNRGSSHGGGGGSDSENYIQRDLLMPDEISQVVKPKGKTKRYGGSCIIFVDEYRPFYLPKFDTMSHPLFNITGSGYPKGIPNNTYIQETYSQVKAARSSKYKQTLTDFYELSKEKAAQAEAEKEADEEAEQAELNSLFSMDDFKSEDETIKNSMEDEVEDFDESILDDVNPVLDNFNFGDDNYV